MADKKTPLDIARELFHRVITENGRTSWSMDFKNSYIRNLAIQNSLSPRKLSPTILQKPKNEIQATIENYDPEYKLFLSYHRLYESFGTKLIGMYHLKGISQEEKRKFLNPEKTMSYNFGFNEEWQVYEYLIKNGIAKVTLAKTAYQPINATLKKINFDDITVWDTIKKAAMKILHTGENLLEIRATITAEKRSIITLSVDLKTNIIEIGNDLFQADQDGNKITHQIRDSDRKSALRVLSEYLEITQASTEGLISSLSNVNPVVTQKTEKELHRMHDEVMLIVRVMAEYYVRNIDEDRLSEYVEVSMENQKLSEIKKSAEKFYDENETFEGFFEEYPEHKTDEGTYTQKLSSTDADISNTKAFVLIVRNAYDFEKHTFEGAMKGKVVDWLTYHFDIYRGEVEIRNGIYSEYAQRTFLDRIVQIDQQAKAKAKAKRNSSRKTAGSIPKKSKDKGDKQS